MRLLLDTHLFLWWRSDLPKLPAAAREAIEDGASEVFISAVVAWEIVIKRALGRLHFNGAVAAAISEEGFLPLPVHIAHADEVTRLPLHHRDPFDRLLVAQARIEGLTLVTVDPKLARYDGFERLPI